MAPQTLRTSLLAGAAALALIPSARADFFVRTVNSPSPITDINVGEARLADQPTAGSGAFSVVNFVGEGGDGTFPGGVNFPGPHQLDDFAVEALANFTINVAGSYTFRVNSDDGFRFRYDTTPDGSGGTVLGEFVGPRGPGDTDMPAGPLPAGFTSNTRLTFFERGGGDELEFSYSRDGSPFALVGSTADITTAVPEPGSIAALAGGTALLAGVRRRRN